jgi:hypothetical protein
LTGAPNASGSISKEKGLARSGNARVRQCMIQLAWRFLMFQKDSALAQWFHQRTINAPRTRKTMIVALARKLLIALWRLGASLTDAHGCIMGMGQNGPPNTSMRCDLCRAAKSGLPSTTSSRPPQACPRARNHQGSAWQSLMIGMAGATAVLDGPCARGLGAPMGRDGETGFQIEQRNGLKENAKRTQQSA